MLCYQEEFCREDIYMEKLILFLNKLLSRLKIFRRNLFYVGGNDALQPPLSKDEEEDLLKK